MNKVSDEVKLIKKFIEIHKKNSEVYQDKFANETVGYNLYQILPFDEYDEEYKKTFEEVRNKVLKALKKYSKEELSKEISFMSYIDNRKNGTGWTLYLAEYVNILKKSENIASYWSHLRKGPKELEEIINFTVFFSIDKLKDFCNKYILIDVLSNLRNFPTNKPRGTQDIYPPRSLIYQKIQQVISEVLYKNNYQPIIFPTYEYEKLFFNSLGSSTDIIRKEMYNFQDKKGRELVLRPEGTASVARLVCENKLIKEGYPLKFYYWANMFRYERPQKGRYREFWQLGIELINAQGVCADYQILKIICDILDSLGIKEFVFNLNYLGGAGTKEIYKKELRKFIEENNFDLCKDCKERYNNPLRILDCLICKEIIPFPFYKNAWSSKDKNYVEELNQLLENFKLPYKYNYHLVRGLDYYTGLVFEVDLGERKAILGGGRYDNLYQEIGNMDVPAVGFAMGIERLVDYLETSELSSKLLKNFNKVDIFFLVSIPDFYLDVLGWKSELEKYPLVIDYNLEVRKLKSLAKIIDYYQPKLMIILGEKELKSKKILIKDCQKGQEFLAEKERLIENIIHILNLEL